MANLIRKPIIATGPGAWVSLDYMQSPFNATVGVDLTSAVGATYGLQFTLSDVNDTTITPDVRADVNLPAGTVVSGISVYQNPVTFVRINVAALTSGTIYMNVVQGVSAR